MRAVAYHGRRDVRVGSVPDPGIEQPTDADHPSAEPAKAHLRQRLAA